MNISLDMEHKLTPVEKRLKIARTWATRMDTLIKAKRSQGKSQTDEYSEAQFCREHKFDVGFFNRNKNLKVIPSQKTVDLFEKALKKERV